MFKYIFLAASLSFVIPQASFAQSATLSNLVQIEGNAFCDPDSRKGFGIKQNGAYVAEFEIYRGSALIEKTNNVLLGQCWNLSRFHGSGLIIKGFSYTGLVWNPRIQFMEVDLSDERVFLSVTTHGTTLNPRAEAHIRVSSRSTYRTDITEHK